MHTDISLTNVSDEATPLTETTPLTEGKDSETTKKAPNCLYGLSWVSSFSSVYKNTLSVSLNFPAKRLTFLSKDTLACAVAFQLATMDYHTTILLRKFILQCVRKFRILYTRKAPGV